MRAAEAGWQPSSPSPYPVFRPGVIHSMEAQIFVEETHMAAPIRRTAKPIQKGKKLGSVKPLSAKMLKTYTTLKTY